VKAEYIGGYHQHLVYRELVWSLPPLTTPLQIIATPVLVILLSMDFTKTTDTKQDQPHPSNPVVFNSSLIRMNGFVKELARGKGVSGLYVSIYDGRGNLLDKVTSSGDGKFHVTFKKPQYRPSWLLSRVKVHFKVHHLVAGSQRLKYDGSAKAETFSLRLWRTRGIVLFTDIFSQAPGVGVVPAEGWVGGFPTPAKELPFTDNLANLTNLTAK